VVYKYERIKQEDKIDIKLKRVSEIVGLEYWGNGH